MYTIEDFRKRFQEVRKKANYRKRILSMELGKRSDYISNVERGKEDMTMTDFLRACEILKVSPEVVFNLERGDLIMEHENLLEKINTLPHNVEKYIKKFFKYR